MESAAEIVGSMGLNSPVQLSRTHLLKRVTRDHVTPYSALYPEVTKGSLLNSTAPESLQQIWNKAYSFKSSE